MVESIDYENRLYAYVVEGITDEDKLKKAGCKYVIKSGGLFVQSDILNLIRLTAKVRKLVIITDPDGPGLKIRKLIEKELPKDSWIDCWIKKEMAKDSKKVGIAQMKMKDLRAVLSPFLDHDSSSKEIPLYQIYDLYSLHLAGENSKRNKENLERNLNIHIPSSKTLCSYLNMLGLRKEQILELLKERTNE